MTEPEPGRDPSDLPDTLRLVRAAKAGDGAALNRLLEHYLPRVRRFVAKRLGRDPRHANDIDDLASSVLVTMATKLDDYVERRTEGFGAWVSKIVYNRILDFVRREQALRRGAGQERVLGDCSPSTAAGIEPEFLDTPSQVAIAHEIEDLHRRIVATLEPRYRRIIELHDYRHLVSAEILAAVRDGSEQLEGLDLRTTASIRALYSRAKRELRSRLQRRLES